jgi:hypothetical protein
MSRFNLKTVWIPSMLNLLLCRPSLGNQSNRGRIDGGQTAVQLYRKKPHAHYSFSFICKSLPILWRDIIIFTIRHMTRNNCVVRSSHCLLPFQLYFVLLLYLPVTEIYGVNYACNWEICRKWTAQWNGSNTLRTSVYPLSTWVD